jgi:hypothetical protein
VRLGKHRLGDGTDLVLLQLVGVEQGPEISGKKSTRRTIADRRTAFAAKLRKSASSAKEVGDGAAPEAAPAAGPGEGADAAAG